MEQCSHSWNIGMIAGERRLQKLKLLYNNFSIQCGIAYHSCVQPLSSLSLSPPPLFRPFWISCKNVQFLFFLITWLYLYLLIYGQQHLGCYELGDTYVDTGLWGKRAQHWILLEHKDPEENWDRIIAYAMMNKFCDQACCPCLVICASWNHIWPASLCS